MMQFKSAEEKELLAVRREITLASRLFNKAYKSYEVESRQPAGVTAQTYQAMVDTLDEVDRRLDERVPDCVFLAAAQDPNTNPIPARYSRPELQGLASTVVAKYRALHGKIVGLFPHAVWSQDWVRPAGFYP